jgi:adenylylsulfate kinase
MQKATNIFWHSGEITRKDRERANGHKGVTLWLTGLSASGKSTVARKLEEKLFEMGCQVMVLDGDNVRHGLNKNLGFSREDREENIRRVAELAKLLTSNGIINITAFISPYRADRARAREIQAEGDFLEVFVDCPLEACEARDPKGLYAKARRGEIKVFTGIDDPYEEPEDPELVLDTRANDIEGSANLLVEFLAAKGIIKNG